MRLIPTRNDPGMIMDAPAVSIIMAIKNAEGYLAEALDSVTAQTCRAYEIIVVDGGSMDDSMQIALSYPNTICISQNGDGLPDAWNTGLEAARAPLITFLDSDDIWPPSKLAHQLAYLRTHPGTDCVIGKVKFFNVAGQPTPPGFKPALLKGSHIGYLPGTAMIRRGVFDRIGKFEARWQIAGDLAWFAKLRALQIPTHVMDDVLLYKRVHARNLSYTTAWSTHQRELMQLLREEIERRRSSSRNTSI